MYKEWGEAWGFSCSKVCEASWEHPSILLRKGITPINRKDLPWIRKQSWMMEISPFLGWVYLKDRGECYSNSKVKKQVFTKRAGFSRPTTGPGFLEPSALVSSNSVIRAAARRRSLSVSFGRKVYQPGSSADGLEQAGKKTNFVFVYRFVLVSLEREFFPGPVCLT